jgi:hypothetical protein
MIPNINADMSAKSSAQGGTTLGGFSGLSLNYGAQGTGASEGSGFSWMSLGLILVVAVVLIFVLKKR